MVSWRKAGHTVCNVANQLNKMRAENGSLDLTTWRSSVTLAKEIPVKGGGGGKNLNGMDLRTTDTKLQWIKTNLPRDFCQETEKIGDSKKECGEKKIS